MSTGKDLNPSYIKQGGRRSEGKRFRFQNFAQRLAGADIDVHHRLTADDMAEWRARELGEAAEGDERPFALQTLERWEELNQTRPFKQFRKEMQPLLLSVPLILRRQTAVFALLAAHLARAPADALKPMLEVAAALAVDLRQEYTPHFGPLLRSLSALLSGPAASDVSSLEDIFTTVAYLLKYLLKYLLAELPATFAHYTPLLSHPKPHVRDFAAETFSFLVRQVPRAALSQALRAAVLPQVGVSAALDGGIALLLFHAVKGMPQRFNSRAPEIVASLLGALRPSGAGSGGGSGGGGGCGVGVGDGGQVERAGGEAAGAAEPSPMEVDTQIGSVGGSSASGAAGAAGGSITGAGTHVARGPAADGAVSRSALLGLLSEALQMMNEHTRRAHCEPVWGALVAAVGETGAAAAWALGQKKTERGQNGMKRQTGTGHAAEPEHGSQSAAPHAAAPNAHAAAAHAAAVFRLAREWVANRRASRIPTGGLPPLLRAVAPLLSGPILGASARLRLGTREALIGEALRLVSSAIVADTPRAESEADLAAAAGVLPPSCAGPAVLKIAQDLLPSVFSGLEDGAGGALPGGRQPRLALLPLDFGVSLVCWRHFGTTVLPPLLRLCAGLSPTDPSSVLSTLYALSTSDTPLPPLALPPECVIVAVAALQALADPPPAGIVNPPAGLGTPPAGIVSSDPSEAAGNRRAPRAKGKAAAAREAGRAAGLPSAAGCESSAAGGVEAGVRAAAADEAVARDAWAAAAVVRCACPSSILGRPLYPPRGSRGGEGGGAAFPPQCTAGGGNSHAPSAELSGEGFHTCRAALVCLLSSPPPGRLAALPPPQRAAVCAAAIEALTELAAAEVPPRRRVTEGAEQFRPAREGAVDAEASATEPSPTLAAGKAALDRKGKSRRASSSVTGVNATAAVAGAAAAVALPPIAPRLSPAHLALGCLARHLNEVHTSEGSLHTGQGGLHGQSGLHTGEVVLHGCGPSAALLGACACAVRGETKPTPRGRSAPPPTPPPPPHLGPVWPPLLRCVSHGSTAVRGAGLELLLALHEAGWLPADEPAGGTAAADETGGGPLGASRPAAAGGEAGGAAGGASAVPASGMGSVMSAGCRESTSQLLRLCQALEACPHAPTSQQLVLDADALARLAGAGVLPPSGLAIASQYALGMLRIRFARVWVHVPPLLQALLQTDPAPKAVAGLKLAGPRSSRIWALIVEALARAHGAGGGGSAAAEAEEHDTEGGEPTGHDPEARPQPDIEGRAEAPAGRHRAALPDLSMSASSDTERPDLSLAVGRAWAESISGSAAETDLAHLASQLLRAFGVAGSPLHRLAVVDSGALMPLWRRLAHAHLMSAALAAAREEQPPREPAAPPPGAAPGAHAPAAARAPAGPAPPKRLLSDWLRFFSAVEAPRSLSGAATLYSDCSALLAHPLPSIQSLALDCLVRWDEPPLVKHRKQLAGLIDGKTFRENLTLFSVDSHHSTLTPEDRALLLPVLSRILFSRLTRRVGRGSSKSGMASTRATVFAFFGGFAPQELRTLLDLMLAPIRIAVALHSTPAAQPSIPPGDSAAGGPPGAVAPVGRRGGESVHTHGAPQPTPAAEPRPYAADIAGGGSGGSASAVTVWGDGGGSASAVTVWGDGGGRAACLRGVHGSTLLGVLRSLHEAVAQLGGALLPYLPELLDTTNLVLRCARSCSHSSLSRPPTSLPHLPHPPPPPPPTPLPPSPSSSTPTPYHPHLDTTTLCCGALPMPPPTPSAAASFPPPPHLSLPLP